MVTSTKGRNRGDVVHWETNPNYTRDAGVIEGLDGQEFSMGMPLEAGTGTNFSIATTGGGITAILLTNVGTIATGATASATVLVRGAATVIEENLVGVTGVDNAAIIAAIAADQLHGVISRSVGDQQMIPDVLS